MANSILGQAALTTSPATVATAPAGGCVANILLSNTTGSTIGFSLALVKSGETVANQKYIHWRTPCEGYQAYERGGIPLAEGDFIVAYAQANGLNINVVSRS